MRATHPESRGRPDLVPTISGLEAGRLRVVTGATAADVATEAGRDASRASAASVVAWLRLGPSSAVDDLLAEAAETVAGHPPRAGTRHFLPTVVRRWCRDLAPATAVVLLDGPPPGDRARAVATLDVAEKLARAGAAVALFLPDATGDDDPYLRARYGELRFRPPPPEPQAAGGRDADPLVGVLAFAGAPHPMSRAERRLADAVARHPALAGTLAFNARVTTVHGTTPCVDLLWPEGRVVFEVDGDEHAEPARYAADRRRDLELVTSGYLVVRFVNRDVLTDPDRIAASMAAVVDVRRRTHP